MNENEILVAKEVAQKLRVDIQRVYELCRSKSIPFILLGQRQYRFSNQAIEKFLQNGGVQDNGVTDDSN